MEERSNPVKRNTLVLCITLFIMATFAWAGWANWEYRKQAADKTAQGELVPATSDDPTAPSPLIGKPAPDFTLEDLSGKKVSLASFKGKAVLVNFWATWCGPCKIETPWLVELRNQYASQGFEILGVSVDDLDLDDKAKLGEEKQDIAKFVEKMQMPYPVLINGDSLSHPYGGLDAMPSSFYVDRNGTIVDAQMGISSKDDIEAKIRKALGGAGTSEAGK
jgi:thiol-disulfide isomerase/thioredoxin